MSDLEKLAGSLTKARKALVLALPADGSWGRAPSRAVAKRLWWSMNLIDHRHCPPSPDEEWGLTPLGLRLRAHLQEREG